MLGKAIGRGDVEEVLASIPYFSTLGIEITSQGDTLVTKLPFAERHIGNETLRALHGGVVAAFLDATATMTLVHEGGLQNVPRPINLTVDYLRPGRPEVLFAEARISKRGRRMASVRAMCWQGDRDKPVAEALSHFLIGDS